MERFTISLDRDLIKAFAVLITGRGVRHGKLNLVAVDHGRSNPYANLKAAR